MAVAAQQDAQKEARKNTPLMPFRFYTPVGETKEIVIVDDAPSFMRHEHCMQDRRTKRWDVFVPCIDEHANCPACNASTRPSYFAMFFTIIDLTPYVNSDGEEIAFSKKLMVVKTAQQKKIMRYYEREGTLRGMVLEMTRDGDKDASIGDPEFLEFMSEDDLQSYVYDYTDKEGVVHEVLCDEPYDYDALFPEMSEDTLAALVGGGHSTGSRSNDDRALGRGRGRAAQDNYDDDQGGDGGAWAGGGGRRVASRRGPAAQEPAQDVEYAEQPARGRRAPAAAPAAPARSARPVARRAAPAAEVIDPDDNPEAGAEGDAPWQEGEEAEVAAPARRSAPRRAAPAAAPEPAAAAPRANVAARRAALRR